jgi:hypothetical protein
MFTVEKRIEEAEDRPSRCNQPVIEQRDHAGENWARCAGAITQLDLQQQLTILKKGSYGPYLRRPLQRLTS